jgi:hypothetical protein
MTTRLTAGLRFHILSLAIKARFDGPEKKLAEKGNTLTHALYQAKFGAAMCKRMAALPDGWLPTLGAMTVEFMKADGRCCSRLTVRTRERLPYPAKSSSFVESTKLLKRLRERCERYDKERGVFEKEQRQIRRELETALKSFRSLESLLKAWPELEPYTKGIDRAADKPLAVPIADINSKLGLGGAA